MIGVLGVYEKVKADVNSTENGVLTYSLFNTFSEGAELSVIGFLTGGISGEGIPINFNSQKSRDILSDFIVPVTGQVNDGIFPKPADYYTPDVFYRMGNDLNDDNCNDKISGTNTDIEILDGQQFQNRTTTFINEIKPTASSPIAKVVGDNFVIFPKDIGTVILEYIRVPKFAKIVPVLDQTYNREVADLVNSVDYEWHPGVRDLIIWFIKQAYVQYNGNQQSKQANNEAAQTTLK